MPKALWWASAAALLGAGFTLVSLYVSETPDLSQGIVDLIGIIGAALMVSGALWIACLVIMTAAAWFGPAETSPLGNDLRIPRPIANSPTTNDEYVRLEDAGRWLYEHGNEGVRSILGEGGGAPFDSIAEHGAAWVLYAGEKGICRLYARRESGLPMEAVTAAEIEGSLLKRALNQPQKLPVDASIKRSALQPILRWYEADIEAQHQKALMRDLWRLREVGVPLRNRSITSHTALQTWLVEVDAWREALYAKAAEISPGLADHLRTLNEMGPPPANSQLFAAEPRHGHMVTVMSEILRRMSKYLEENGM
jgi:hypothetical protein